MTKHTINFVFSSEDSVEKLAEVLESLAKHCELADPELRLDALGWANVFRGVVNRVRSMIPVNGGDIGIEGGDSVGT